MQIITQAGKTEARNPFLWSSAIIGQRIKQEMPMTLLCRMQTCQKHKVKTKWLGPAHHQKTDRITFAAAHTRVILQMTQMIGKVRMSVSWRGRSIHHFFEALEGIAVLQQLFLKWGGSESRGPVSVKLVTGSLSGAHCVSICSAPRTHTVHTTCVCVSVSLSVLSDACSHLWRHELHHAAK